MFRVLVLAVATAIVGLVAVGLVGGQQSAEAQAATASATRSFSSSEVASGGPLTVTITVDNYGGIGQLTEEFPADFTFDRSSPEVTPSGQTLTFNLVADMSVSYTLTAPTTTETRSISGFSGTLDPAVTEGVGGQRPFLGDRLVPTGTADSVGHQVVLLLRSGVWWSVDRDDNS